MAVVLRAALELQRTRAAREFALNAQFELAPRGVTAVYGRSGAGKTSILRCLAGLEPHSSCAISFGNTLLQAADGSIFLPPEQRKIAYVFQDNRLLPHLNVENNLRFAYQRRFDQHGPDLDAAVAWFELESLLPQYPTQLSGGEARRVALARAALSAPRLLLLDEPLTGVDQAAKARLLKSIRQLQQQLDCPMLYISHHIDEVSQIADYLMLLEAGRIISHGPLVELCSRLDASLAHEEDAAAILHCHVIQHDQDFALTELACGDQQRIFVSETGLQMQQKVRIRIPARDVSIALTPATDSSILNILQVQIESLQHTHSSRMLLRLKIGEQFLLARITRKSAEQLHLCAGLVVYAQIKSVALLNQAMAIESE